MRQLSGEHAETVRVRLNAFKARLGGGSVSTNGQLSHAAASENSGDSGLAATDDELLFVSKDLFKTCYEYAVIGCNFARNLLATRNLLVPPANSRVSSSRRTLVSSHSFTLYAD